ncbi:MAG: hypothetical protein ACE5GU_07485 [Candidatus Scalinduaceae bacterium]
MVIKRISLIFTAFVIMIFGLAISCTSIEKVETVEKVAEPKAETVKKIVEDTAEPPEEVAEEASETAEKAAEETAATVEEVSGQKAEPEKKEAESVH